MSLAKLVLRNAVRNQRRSLLTAASVAVSIALLIVFLAAYRFLESPPASTTERSHLVLVVMASASPLQPMPVSYRSRIERLEGVRRNTGLLVRRSIQGRKHGDRLIRPRSANSVYFLS